MSIDISKLSEEVRERLRLASYYKDVFSTKAGRAVLHDLARKADFNKAPNFSEREGNYRQGQRYMVLHILKMSGDDPVDLIETMQQKQQEEKFI